MLADDLCHLGLKPMAASSESPSSERWTLLSLVLSQHIKNGKHIYSLEFVKCKYRTCALWKVERNLRSSRILNLYQFVTSRLSSVLFVGFFLLVLFVVFCGSFWQGHTHTCVYVFFFYYLSQLTMSSLIL